MKTKTIIFATMMSLALGLFIACSSDEDSDDVLLNNEKLLKSELGKSTIAPLNTIPASVRAKASEEELAVFSKLSSVFYMDYSFLDSAFYQDNKDVILHNLNSLYNTYVNNKQKPVYFTVLSLTSQPSRLQAPDDCLMITEQGENRIAIASFFGAINGYGLTNHIELIPDSIGVFHITDVRTLISPDGYQFSGDNDYNVNNNILSVNADGYLYPNSHPNTHIVIGPTELSKNVCNADN